MTLIVKRPEADELASELAQITGETVETAVVRALEERLARARRRAEAKRTIGDIQRRVADLPVLDDRSPEDMLYDENGLPR